LAQDTAACVKADIKKLTTLKLVSLGSE